MRILTNLNVVGKPAELVEEVLQGLVKKLSSEKKLLKKKILKPEKMGKNFFSGFLEVELEVKGFEELVEFLLDYSPVTIEILDSKDVTISLSEFQSGISELVARFQEYDEGIKGLNAANMLLRKQLDSFLQQKKGKSVK
jgi:hypothetical protein